MDIKEAKFIVKSFLQDELDFIIKHGLIDDENGKVIVTVPTAHARTVALVEHERVYTKETLDNLMKSVFKDVSVTVRHKEPHEKYSPMLIAIGRQPYGV